MIIVVGQPLLRGSGPDAMVGGQAARIAVAAAAGGSTVQLVGKVGEDPEGDALVLALARAGVGHVALLRDPARRTPRLVEESADVSIEAAATASADSAAIEPADPASRPQLDAADVDLGLRYLTEFSVLVVAVPVDEALTSTLAAAAGWASATLIVLAEDGAAAPQGLPADAIVLQSPAPDPDGPFDILVGDLAAAIDGGLAPDEAFRKLVGAQGWQRAEA